MRHGEHGPSVQPYLATLLALVVFSTSASARAGEATAVEVAPQRVELNPGGCAAFYPKTVDNGGNKIFGTRRYEYEISNTDAFTLDTEHVRVCHKRDAPLAATVFTVTDTAINASATAIYRIIGYKGPDPTAAPPASAPAEPSPAYRATVAKGLNFAPPVGLSVTAGLVSAVLRWQAVTGAPGYVVERMELSAENDPAAGTWVPVGPIPIATPPYKDDALRPSRQYRYRVSAYSDAGNRSWAEVSFSTQEYQITGIIPYVFVSERGSQVGQISRLIQFHLPPTANTTVQASKGNPSGYNGFFSGLGYVVTVAADDWPAGSVVPVDLKAVSTATGEVIATAHEDVLVPEWFAPLQIAATPKPGVVRLSWTGIQEATGYTVIASRAGFGQLTTTLPPGSTSFDFVDPGAATSSAWLVPGASVRFIVNAALPASGTVAPGVTATRTQSGTLDIVVPAAPAEPYVVPGLASATLYWRPASAAAGYVVERMDLSAEKDPAAGTWVPVGPIPIVAPPYKDDALRPSRQYRYRVSEYSPTGLPSWAEVSFSTREYQITGITPYVFVSERGSQVGQISRLVQFRVPAIPATTARAMKGDPTAFNGCLVGSDSCFVTLAADSWPPGGIMPIDIEAVSTTTGEVTATAHQDVPVPQWFAPLQIAVTPKSGSIRLSWAANPQATEYRIYAGRSAAVSLVKALPAGSSSYDFIDPAAGTSGAWLVTGATLRFTVDVILSPGGTLHDGGTATRVQHGTVDVSIP